MPLIERNPLNDQLVAEFTFSRGHILSCFSQVEWFMAKILIEAHAFPEYGSLNLDFSIAAETRAKKLRTLLSAEGRLRRYAGDLLPLIDTIMSYAEVRNFMAHGVLVTRPSEQHGLIFRMKMFKRMPGADDHEGKIDFAIDQLIHDTSRLSATTKQFVSRMRVIWQEQGMRNFDIDAEDAE